MRWGETMLLRLIVKGALAAAAEWPEVQLLLVGDTAQIEEHLGESEAV